MSIVIFCYHTPMPLFAKKSLGQNFLIQPQICIDMTEAGNTSNEDTLIEIGPGTGMLTKELLTRAKKVIALEKDDRLIQPLKEMFSKEIEEGKLELIHTDVLTYTPPQETYKVIANIPYYITGKIIRYFLEQKHQPQSMTLLVQKEVAERITTKNQKESLLSISVKVFGEPSYYKTVKAGNFRPVPKVDSAILHIDNISRNNFLHTYEDTFFDLLHAGFANKRKKLSTNLKKKVSLETFDSCTIDPHKRAEDITVNDWLCLSRKMSQ